MKAMRTAFLAMLACLIVATASAQVAPNNQGDIGLFTIPTADQPQPGTFTLGAYGWLEQLVAGDLPGTDFAMRDRVYRHTAGEFSLGYAFTRHWSIFASAGAEQYRSRGGWLGGAINGIQLPAPFESNEARKVRVGTKVTLYSEADPSFRVGLWLAAWAPINNATLKINGVPAEGQINSRRTDWEWGVNATKGVFTGMVSYILSGEHDNDVRVSNRLRFGVGVDVPLAGLPMHVIGELDRTIMDGGDFPAPSYSMMNAGVRFWVGQTGVAVSTALNMDMDLLFKHGNNPSPFGGILGVTYAAWPPPPPAPVVVPAPAPAEPVVIEEKAAPAPAPAPAPPPPPAPKKTTDEIFFDAGSARLTNIAKAVLDGIALRMKNDLNSTAAISGYSDNAGKEDANVAISARRAEAAKEYLVTRHGIDPNRIATFARGSQDAAYDNATPEGKAKNRRAVIVVTLVSGG
jgi:outer membrane protein OmpA-like peptidoglycan-associated protein